MEKFFLLSVFIIQISFIESKTSAPLSKNSYGDYEHGGVQNEEDRTAFHRRHLNNAVYSAGTKEGSSVTSSEKVDGKKEVEQFDNQNSKHKNK